MPFQYLPAVLAEAAPVGRRFVDAGFRVYLVGGIVRDLWLDRDGGSHLDLDLTTDAMPDETKAVIGGSVEALWLQGERFGTIGALIEGREYEITTHRSESYSSHSRKPDVVFASAIEEDLARRDFTINAMAVELPDGELIDPFGGADDLTDGLLRTPLDPEVSFNDDPLRMLRAARFSAGYGLTADPKVLSAIQSMADRLDIVSAERVRDEFDKLLSVPSPSPGLGLLAATELLSHVIPEVDPATLPTRAADIDRLPPRSELRLAALLVDEPLDGVRDRLSALKYPNNRSRLTLRMLRAARAIDDEPTSDEAYRRWYAEVGDLRDDAHALAMLRDPRHASTIGEMEHRRLELGTELHDFSLPIDGDEVKEILGVGEGRAVGDALDYLRSVRFAHGPIAEADARRLLTEWAADRRLDPAEG